MATTRPELSREQLQAAWHAIRRQGWPDTLDEVLADPVRGRMVRVVAQLNARGHAISTAAAATPPAVRRTTVVRPEPPPLRGTHPRAQPAPTARAHATDRKRLASGDRDDD